MDLLTIDQAAERLATGARFVRRLIAEHRIAYIKVGKLMRIATNDLDDFINRVRHEPPGDVA